jgi:dihydroneopterin aldolase
MENIIFIENLIIEGIHGHWAIQNNTPRQFIFTIKVWVQDISNAVSTEDLAQTFNYHYAINSIHHVMNGPSCVLIETLGSYIVDRILLHPLAAKIKLTLSKRELESTVISGLTIVRSKSETLSAAN